MTSNIDQEVVELFRRLSSPSEELANTFNPEWTVTAEQRGHLDSPLESSATD